jgi:hypothetical protein
MNPSTVWTSPVSRKAGWLAIAGFCLAIVGCSNSGYYQVHGKVVDRQGQPIPGLEGSQIVFSATGGGTTSSIGEIAADGSFTMFTERPGDGVPPGEYVVYIPRRYIDPERPAPQVIDSKFEKLETSPLTAKVEAKTNTFEFKVDRSAGRGA